MRKINILLYSLILLTTVSCNSFLDIKPYGRTIPKTAEEFSALLHNHLNKIDQGSDNVLVGNASRALTFDVESGDDFEACLTSSNSLSLRIYVGDIAVSTNGSNIYRALYEIIRDCNIVLNEMKETGTSESEKVRGLAYAMRGVAYYQLMRLYCEKPETGNWQTQRGLPLVMTFDMEEKPLRSSLENTISLIERDLKKSLDAEIKDPVYRFTEDVVKGYLARMYFWTKQWDLALPIAQELLKKYPLLPRDSYEQMMTTSYDMTGNQLLKSYRTISTSSSAELVSITRAVRSRPVSRRFLINFNDEEKATDIRYNLWVNGRREAIKVFFCGMRSAEFKLMEAECYYHLNNDNAALMSINELRENRISNYQYLSMDMLPQELDTEIIKVDTEGNPLTPLIRLILQERRKELFLEGDRFFEQKRNGQPEYWTAYNGRKYTTRKFMYTFPIPYHDIDIIGGELQQNPGYEDLETI